MFLDKVHVTFRALHVIINEREKIQIKL